LNLLSVFNSFTKYAIYAIIRSIERGYQTKEIDI